MPEKRLIRASVPVLAVVALAVSLTTSPRGEAAESAPAADSPEVLARGEYLVTIGGCDDCHTPKKMGPHGPEPDLSRRLAGHPEGVQLPAAKLGEGWVASTNEHLTAWEGPWGRTYAFNLTPDENTGIGIWSEEMFVKAMRTGRHMGQSRPIMPPMPWQNVARMTDEDLHAVWAFLRALPPIHNRVPDYQPPGGAEGGEAPGE